MYGLQQNLPKMNQNPVFNPSYSCHNTTDIQQGINTFTEPSLHLSTPVNNLTNNFMNQYPLGLNNLVHFNEKIEKNEGKLIQNCQNNEILPNVSQQSLINFQYKQQFCVPSSQFYQNCLQLNPQPCMDYKLLNFSQNNRQNTKVPKKSRVLFSQWQINELEKLFKKQKYVTSNERDLMAKRLKLHGNQIKIWFQNRRYKVKKKNEAADSEN